MMRLLVALALAACGYGQSYRPCVGEIDREGLGLGWNGWSPEGSNTRYQHVAGILANEVPQLKLKWAFGFPNVKSVFSAPTVIRDRVYIGVDTGTVYSIDAFDHCVWWTFQAEAGVRSAIAIVSDNAYFGDLKGNAYAVNATGGKLVWKVHLDDHASARVTGAPKVYKGRVYFPVASGEEGAGTNPKYACCTFRGSVVALDAASGRLIWKTYTIGEKPKLVGKNSNGIERFAPAGAGVWNSPTIDAKRNALYIGTGDAYTEPAAKTTDSIMAMDLDSGKILWSVQDTENDAWLAGCTANPTAKQNSENCPKQLGPDHDYGASPILANLNGRTILIAGQKSGNVWVHDPDKRGAVLWRTALVNNTTEFGGKIVWGGAADDQNAYFGLGPGGIAAVQLRDGERKWFAAIQPAAGRTSHPGHEGALSAIPGVVFSGGWDGVLRALGSDTGKVIWEYDTVRDFETVNGVPAKGGSISVSGPTIAGGMLFVGSGYVGVRQGIPGNVLLAFGVR